MIVFLAPKGTPAYFGSLLTAYMAGNADTANVTLGRDSLRNQNLSGNMDCELVLFDTDIGALSSPVDFKLGEGGATSVPEGDKVNVRVFADRGTIFLNQIL